MSQTPLLSGWSSFYVMTGSSAAALTGLMFVVISLVTGREGTNSRDGISAFSTPTVMHFAAVLLVSAVLVAPWHSLVFAGVSVGLVGLWGLVYLVRVTFLTKRLSADTPDLEVRYTPDLEDLVWYTLLPFVAYAVIFVGAVGLEILASKALFAIGAGLVLLILIGVRNAWDVVTFLAVYGPPTSSR